MNMKRIALALVLAAASPMAMTYAQGTPSPAPQGPPAAPPAPADTNLPPVGASYLAERYGLSSEEAANRIRLQNEISELVSQVKRASDPEFGAIWVQHQPVFQINISYVNPSDRKLLQLQIDPKIRRYVKLVKASRSAREAQADADQIAERVRAAGVTIFAGAVDEETGDFVLEVPTPEDRQKVLQALGADRKFLKIVVKPIAEPTAAPSGVQPGDYINGGHYFWQTPYLSGMTAQQQESAKGCSVAFQATYGGKLGILTAGHCNPGPDGTGYWHAINRHWVEMPTPAIARWASGTKYDFQWHEITGYSRSNAVYYFNQASVVGLPQNGWLYVDGTVGYYGQTRGMVACKSGRVTGITCGDITSGNYYYNGAYGWIRVYRASGVFLGQKGDSGGAVFSDATKGSYIKAYGIVTAAQPIGGGASELVYSPIDYIDPWNIVLVTN